MMKMVVTTGATRRAKLRSNRHHRPINQHATYYTSKHRRKIITETLFPF